MGNVTRVTGRYPTSAGQYPHIKPVARVFIGKIGSAVTATDVISRPPVNYIVKPFNAQTLKTKIESVLAAN